MSANLQDAVTQQGETAMHMIQEILVPIQRHLVARSMIPGFVPLESPSGRWEGSIMRKMDAIESKCYVAQSTAKN